MSAPHSPVARYLRTPGVDTSDDACWARQLGWIRTALARRSPSGSPYGAFEKLSEHASELTPGLQDLTERAYRSLLAPMPMACLLDQEDAKVLLNLITHLVTHLVTHNAVSNALLTE